MTFKGVSPSSPVAEWLQEFDREPPKTHISHTVKKKCLGNSYETWSYDVAMSSTTTSAK